MLSRYKTGYNFSPRTFYLALLTVPERHFYTYLEKRKKKTGLLFIFMLQKWRHSWWLLFHKIPPVLLRRRMEL